MKVFIITGASRGIGQAMAERLASAGHTLFCISRTVNEALVRKYGNVHYVPFDLSCSNGLDGLMKGIAAAVDPQQTETVHLINNAAVVEPLAAIGHCEPDVIAANVHVNLLAPMLLTASLMNHMGRYPAEKRILNISSASVKYLCLGMSCYSAAKAGLDTFTRTVALENVRIVSAWPGLIDTALQEEARTQDVSRFAAADTFAMYKTKGWLKTPEEAAERLIRLLLSDAFGDDPVVEDLYGT
ncbi:SDR family NAD(P)-dependent oxidoreductase [Paenibacillus sp. H1-7]|uniref:SDR family NAD(P)-dependent oxidoreductase n=1 Tax=Paenibacillus sp. H1-7 TaxID=2282849 RepID=UPI001EF8B6A9|nr:SDR family NAD(P)-dependent oxidoreductase [Paenibacillus sp. H1-7]